MRRVVYIVIVSLCLFPSLIKASSCTNEERERLQKLADNVTYTLEEVNDNGEIYFNITFSGLSKEIRIYAPTKGYYLHNGTENQIGEETSEYYPLGRTYEFKIYTNSYSCLLKVFRTITVNTPNLNPYYNDPICEGTNDYSLCQKWTKVGLNYDEFVSKVNEYKKQNAINSDKPNTENNEDKGFDFLEIYNKYYVPTLIGMICLLILLIILWIKQNNKNKL